MKQITVQGCEVAVCEDHEAASRAVVDGVHRAAEKALSRFGNFCLCLAGGRTPLRAEALLAQQARAIPWDRVDIFFTDEHVVLPGSPEHNATLARPHLEPLAAQGLKVHPIRTTTPEGRLLTLKESQAEARRYEREIRRGLGPQRKGFDLLILGLGGEDGHVASLLPEKAGFSNPAFTSRRYVEAIGYPPELYPGAGLRITLTPRAFSRSARVLLFATGDRKKAALREALLGPLDPRRNPGSLIRAVSNPPKVITDRAAAALLGLFHEGA